MIMFNDPEDGWQWGPFGSTLFDGTVQECIDFMAKLKHVTREERRQDFERLSAWFTEDQKKHFCTF